MPKPKPNITFVRLTDEQNTGLQQLVANGPGNKSDHIRQAVAEYLARAGLVPTPPHERRNPMRKVNWNSRLGFTWSD